jgi:hypothetical protein
MSFYIEFLSFLEVLAARKVVVEVLLICGKKDCDGRVREAHVTLA